MMDEQTYWNTIGARAWIEMRAVVDEMFKPLTEWLLDGAAGRVLDVGCGTGGTTLAASRYVGANGDAIGIDIAEPLIAAARAHATREGTPARFMCGDAQTFAFEPAAFDRVISRLGVMFFDDPVEAFANLRRAARDHATMRFVAWRSASENAWLTAAERAAAPLLPNIPPRQLDAPGAFAFADRQRVSRILQESGWCDIDIQPIDLTCTLPERDLVRYFTKTGPLGRVFHEADDRTRARVIEVVRAAFDPFVYGPEVRFPAAAWLTRAVALPSVSGVHCHESHPTLVQAHVPGPTLR